MRRSADIHYLMVCLAMTSGGVSNLGATQAESVVRADVGLVAGMFIPISPIRDLSSSGDVKLGSFPLVGAELAVGAGPVGLRLRGVGWRSGDLKDDRGEAIGTTGYFQLTGLIAFGGSAPRSVPAPTQNRRRENPKVRMGADLGFGIGRVTYNADSGVVLDRQSDLNLVIEFGIGMLVDLTSAIGIVFEGLGVTNWHDNQDPPVKYSLAVLGGLRVSFPTR